MNFNDSILLWKLKYNSIPLNFLKIENTCHTTIYTYVTENVRLLYALSIAKEIPLRFHGSFGMLFSIKVKVKIYHRYLDLGTKFFNLNLFAKICHVMLTSTQYVDG